MTWVRQLEHGAILLGKYRVDSVIGRGGMGLVVKAWHLGLDEEVAIKMLRDDIAIADEAIARFVREAQAAAKLKSEHVARIIDVDTFDDGKPYLVMELLEGQDIGQLIAEHGRLHPSLAIDLVIQACEGLAEAHSLGIVHRDIKPSNLFLTSHPDGSVLLKILDFGISKSPAGAELSLTQTWSLLGSPAYMSPEQMRSARHVDARTDIWSLGAVLYEALEGRLPFQAESFSEMCVMVAVDPPSPMMAAPPDLGAIIARCLTKNPNERYANVAELARDLATLAREPDKANIRVDRMYRMLRRGVVRRTPVAGVPITQVAGQGAGRLGTSGLHHLREPSPVDGVPISAGRPASSGVRAASAGIGYATTVSADRSGRRPFPEVARAASNSEWSASHAMPIRADATPTPSAGFAPQSRSMVAAGGALDMSGSGVLAAARADIATGLVGDPAAMAPAHPTYAAVRPLPVALTTGQRYLRPGFELPSGASRTATQMIPARQQRSWLVALLAALVTLAIAAVVILAMRGAPARIVGQRPTKIVHVRDLPPQTAAPPPTDPAIAAAPITPLGPAAPSAEH